MAFYFERGFKRIAWIVSLAGLILITIGGIVEAISEAKDVGLPMAVRIGFLGFGIAVGWFVVVWIVFFLIRWIVKGFSERD